MKPRHTAEQSTVRVNKTEKINATGNATGTGSGASGPAKRGFGGSKKGFGAATASAGAQGAGAAEAQAAAVAVAPVVQAPAVHTAPVHTAPVHTSPVQTPPAAPARTGFGAVATPVAPAAEVVAEPAPRTGGISIAPASFMSELATKAFAPAPEQQPVVPPAVLPTVVEPTLTGEIDKLDAYRAPEGATVLEVVETVYSADGDMEMVGGVACPVDPMERLQCESCQ